VQLESGVVVSYLARLASRPFSLAMVMQWLARGACNLILARGVRAKGDSPGIQN
jgi:hypothetical protein